MLLHTSFQSVCPELSFSPINGFLSSRFGEKATSVMGLVLCKTQQQEHGTLAFSSHAITFHHG